MRKTVWFILLPLLCVAVWFVGASYAFVFMIGLHQWAMGQAEQISSFYYQMSDAGFYPWAAYWTYWNNVPDPNDQELYNASAVVPIILLALIGGVYYRMATGNRTRRRLTRWPWEDDSRRIP